LSFKDRQAVLCYSYHREKPRKHDFSGIVVKAVQT
jgi:hypothetical protein